MSRIGDVPAPLLWQTPSGFDVASVRLELGGSPGSVQSVIAVIGLHGRDLDKCILDLASRAWRESGGEDELTACAIMTIFAYQSPTHQSMWPVTWRGDLIRDGRRYRALRRGVDWEDVKSSALGEGMGHDHVSPSGSALSASMSSSGRGGPPSYLQREIERWRVTSDDDVYAAHSLARWNVPPREYGEPTTEDAVWVEARVRALYLEWRERRAMGQQFDLVSLLNNEIAAAADLPSSAAMPRLAAWRIVMEIAYELLVRHRADLYEIAMAELREAAENGSAPAWVRQSLEDAAPLHSMFYRRWADFADDLFYFELRENQTVSLRFPSFVDVALDVWGRSWTLELFRSTIDGDCTTRRSMLTAYHSLASFVASYRGTRGEPTRATLRSQSKTHEPIDDLIAEARRSAKRNRHLETEPLADDIAHENNILAELSSAISDDRAFRVLKLLYEGMSYQEAANELDLSKSGVKRLADRARERVRSSPKLLSILEVESVDLEKLGGE